MSTEAHTITQSPLLGMEDIEKAVLDSAALTPAEAEERFRRIGDILLLNVQVLDLDEDIDNLATFAVGAAEELSDFLRERTLRFAGRRHWQYRPLILKKGGNNDAFSDLYPPEFRKETMMECLLYNLCKDDRFAEGANALAGLRDYPPVTKKARKAKR